MYHLLIVDDEEHIRELIRKYAEFEGHHVTEAKTGMEAVELCRKEAFDFIIMDAMLPELDGFSACSEIRKFKETPVLMLSARGEEFDRVHGFEVGADDYVVKPFSPKELMMRVEAIMKRTYGKARERKHEVFTYQGLSADFTARIVTVCEKTVLMSPKEYDLFFYLLKNHDIALSREKLITEVWGYSFYGDDRTLDTHIKLLRKSIAPYGKNIVTLRGVGYRFDTTI